MSKPRTPKDMVYEPARGRRPATVHTASEARSALYPMGRCLVCWGPAVSFTSEEVPELLEHLRRSVPELLERAARSRMETPTGCLIAWKCGVSICATNKKVHP